MSTVHRLLNGDWAECSQPAMCEERFHVPNMSANEAQQMPMSLLLPLLEILDPPTSSSKAGRKFWFREAEGQTDRFLVSHRDYDLPAEINEYGDMFWYQNGKEHRDGGKPAVVYHDGRLEWWTNGELTDFSREEER